MGDNKGLLGCALSSVWPLVEIVGTKSKGKERKEGRKEEREEEEEEEEVDESLALSHLLVEIAVRLWRLNISHSCHELCSINWDFIPAGGSGGSASHLLSLPFDPLGPPCLPAWLVGFIYPWHPLRFDWVGFPILDVFLIDWIPLDGIRFPRLVRPFHSILIRYLFDPVHGDPPIRSQSDPCKVPFHAVRSCPWLSTNSIPVRSRY